MSCEVYINGIGVFLPNAPVGNEAMEDVLGRIGTRPSRARARILRSNGITSRYYAIDPATGRATHTNAQLTATAVRNLAGDGFSAENVDVLACGTSLPDQLMPNHGVMVQGELGWPACEVAATAGICLSGIMALKYVWLSIKAGESGQGVATGSENASAVLRGDLYTGATGQGDVDFSLDFLRWMLSDGAGAVWLSNTKNQETISLRIDWIVQKSYAGELATCMYAGAEKREDGALAGWRSFAPEQWAAESIFAVKQDLKLLNKEVIAYTVTRPLRQLLTSGRLEPQAIDWYLPHYSSAFFRDRVSAGMKEAGCDIPQEKWFTNLADKGNTGSASIYIMLEELFHSGRLCRGERLLCYIPESGRFSTAFMQLTVV